MIIEKSKRVISNVDINFENRKYIVKTVSTQDELKKAQKLRYKTFFLDTHKKINPLGTDKDQYDEYFDHLIIVDKENQKVVGTYRITCSLFTDDFYSSSEFNIKNILNLDGIKVEIGRAAIHKEYRNGAVFIMLWKGILQYATMVGARYIFGCSSINVKNFGNVNQIFETVKNQSYYTSDYAIETQDKYSMNSNRRLLNSRTGVNSSLEIPSLIKFYAKGGAKLVGEPAIDREFRCIDFFTLIDVDELMDTKRVKKFKRA